MSRWTDEESGKFQLKNDADPEKSVGLFEIAYIREIRRTGKYFKIFLSKILKIMLYNNLYDHIKARILLFFEEAAVQNIAVNHFYHTLAFGNGKLKMVSFIPREVFFWPREGFLRNDHLLFFCFCSICTLSAGALANFNCFRNVFFKEYIQSNLDLIDLCNVVVGLHFENESRLGISWLRKRPIEDLVCWPNVGLLAQRIKLQLVQAILRKENTWWDMTLHILFLSFFYKVYKALRNFFKDMSVW